MEIKVDLDFYKILSGYDEVSMKYHALKAIELEAELMANKQGYSFKYTIINGKVYRQSYVVR